MNLEPLDKTALISGGAPEAGRLTEQAPTSHASAATAGDRAKFRDVTSWPDARLVAAVQRDPPDEASLDVLVERYWKHLFARCRIMALNSQEAHELARETWCQVLRARHSLRPGGNFLADLTKVATNLWRNACRSAPQTGPMAENRLSSIVAGISNDDGETAVSGNVLPDLNTLNPAEQTLLELRIDQALGRLTPLLRDVLVARFLDGQSCAEIGRRYGRTKQTVGEWVRRGARQMNHHLEESATKPIHQPMNQ